MGVEFSDRAHTVYTVSGDPNPGLSGEPPPGHQDPGDESDLPGFSPAPAHGPARPAQQRRPTVIDLTKWETTEDEPAKPTGSGAPRGAGPRPAGKPAGGPIPSLRPSASAPDYKRNVQRQVREQRAVGSILGVVVTLIALILLAGLGFAGYGAYILSQDLGAQKMSTSQMRAALRGDIDQLQATQEKARKDLRIIQDALIDQQEDTARLADSIGFRLDKLQDAVNEEQRARQSETLLLRRRAAELEQKISEQRR